jgi:hypothetical protein
VTFVLLVVAAVRVSVENVPLSEGVLSGQFQVAAVPRKRPKALMERLLIGLPSARAGLFRLLSGATRGLSPDLAHHSVSGLRAGGPCHLRVSKEGCSGRACWPARSACASLIALDVPKVWETSLVGRLPTGLTSYLRPIGRFR